MIEQQEITMLRESHERELNRIRASAMFILKPEKSGGMQFCRLGLPPRQRSS